MNVILRSNQTIQPINFYGYFKTDHKEALRPENTLNFIENNILNAKSTRSRQDAIIQFKETFKELYNTGIDKWENPKYHQFTATDHSLKAIEEAAKIVRGENPELNKNLTPQQKQDLLDIFKEKIDGIDKGTLFTLAMAFHDINKFLNSKPRLNKNGEIWRIETEKHRVYLSGHKITSDQCYWTCEDDPKVAVKAFQQYAQKMKLPSGAVQYVSDIIECHDNPLKYMIWEIENGRRNPTVLFNELKKNTPIPLKDLAAVYLADQSAKGLEGWNDHLEQISPWRGIFKSLVLERPLSELSILTTLFTN